MQKKLHNYQWRKRSLQRKCECISVNITENCNTLPVAHMARSNIQTIFLNKINLLYTVKSIKKCFFLFIFFIAHYYFFIYIFKKKYMNVMNVNWRTGYGRPTVSQRTATHFTRYVFAEHYQLLYPRHWQRLNCCVWCDRQVLMVDIYFTPL